ncbi:MAG: zinc ribbon domain-containing protein [Halohasta sp.]
MSKITFRADEKLVGRLEGLEASKSEVMREALRRYLDGGEREPGASDSRSTDGTTIDELVTERLDQLVANRTAEPPRRTPPATELTVNVSVEGTTADDVSVDTDREANARKTNAEADQAMSCSQCGESVDENHVYCPNCGEKNSHRLFCECGDEIRSDWRFCPGCGRRTPAADVLDNA